MFLYSQDISLIKMITRSLEKAKEAYKNKDKQASILAHDKKTDSNEEHRSGGAYLKSAVYGGLDGIITTFAVVAGVAGASLSVGIVLILGFANLFADGLSMAIGDYLSTKSEREYQLAERKREQWETENYPDGEKKELVELYTDKGISEGDAKKIVAIMSKHKKAWIDIMMVEELGIMESTESPLKNSIVTFVSFCIFGFIPLLAFILTSLIPFISSIQFQVATFLTCLTLFILGALKTRFTGRNWFISGIEMLLVGGIAAGAAYGIGVLLGGLA
jgi:VIT1/CCC1 family predicted Fe2+/Mn2+ transporter